MNEYKISMAQIDPNGTCNVKCWFCPVAYVPNPDIGKTIMPIELFEGLIQQLVDGKGDFVADSFNGIYTAHYNEVLMYPHFEEMLEVLRKYKLGTVVLSNGTTLTKKRIDIIKKYHDVVWGVCLNIPSAEPDSWSSLVGMNPKVHEHMMQNIEYFCETDKDFVSRNALSIQVNGLNNQSLIENGGWLTALDNIPKFDLDVESGFLKKQVKLFNDRFPDVNVFEVPSLIDRAGYLGNHNVMTNQDAIDLHLKTGKTRVVGCANGREVGGRPNGWIHVNANGDLFICCNDYDFDTIFGNLNDNSLKDIWESEIRQEMIQKSYDTMCRSCASAIWE